MLEKTTGPNSDIKLGVDRMLLIQMVVMGKLKTKAMSQEDIKAKIWGISSAAL